MKTSHFNDTVLAPYARRHRQLVKLGTQQAWTKAQYLMKDSELRRELGMLLTEEHEQALRDEIMRSAS